MAEDHTTPTTPVLLDRLQLLAHLAAHIKDNTGGDITPTVLSTALQHIINSALLSGDTIPGLLALSSQVSNHDSQLNILGGSIEEVTSNVDILKKALKTLIDSQTPGASQVAPQRFLRTSGKGYLEINFDESIKSCAFWVRVNEIIAGSGYLANVGDEFVFNEFYVKNFDYALIDTDLVKGGMGYRELLSSTDASSGPWRRVYLSLPQTSSMTLKLAKDFAKADFASITLYDRFWTASEEKTLAMPGTGIVRQYDGYYEGNYLRDTINPGSDNARLMDVESHDMVYYTI